VSDSRLIIPLGPRLSLQLLPSTGIADRCEAVLHAHLQLGADVRDTEVPPLAQLAAQVYAEVEGLGRSYAVTSANAGEPLQFSLSPAQVAAVGQGAEFGFGIDDARMRVAHTCRRTQRALLLETLIEKRREQ